MLTILRRAIFATIVAFPSVAAVAQTPGPDRIVLLGTKGGPSIRDASHFPTSNVLVINGQAIVVDTGYGVTQRLIQAKVPLRTLRHVFITHHHSDHNLEYGTLLYNAWVAGIKGPVETYGPKGIMELDRGSWMANRSDIDTRIADEGRPDPRKIFHANEYGPGVIMETKTMRVSACRNIHPPIDDSYALKFETAGKTIVFSGDTTYAPALADFAAGADYLIHEVMDEDGVNRLVARHGANASTLLKHLKASHTLAEDVGRIAAKAKVKNLVLTHFVPFDDPEITDEHWMSAVRKHYNGNIIIGRDLLEIPLN
ncbi:MBL fold metallo-hydrolase [Achromobacter sp. Bel]|uniref:MBL fold metallo-hydrolase n=1 Tax=Achromobacter sp. Bel TaxID=2727415 RepID=UPI00145F6D28|nr:MBL fold metallo-hydrolase [Achromobacter sp. Bel]NMK46290.1 MBL fold metallo-hydrolase [Achromobacter sp. Bel]